MSLSRKHYKELAKILGENNASLDLINDILSFCKIDNRAFKPNTFIDRIKEFNGNRLDIKNVSTDITNDKEFFLNK
tara:strand:- start:210 stop:437 length:228 start_codon:yes stop_codon:yes gene_type:complete